MARFLTKREESHGKSPGSLIFMGEQKMQTSYIRVIQYNKKLIVEKELKQIEEIGDLLQKDKVTWLNIDGLQDIALVEKIGSYFNISSLALEDILNTDQRPRFIEDEHNLIIITKSLTYLRDENNIHIEQISFIIGENYLISFQERVGDHFDPVRERLRNNKGRIRPVLIISGMLFSILWLTIISGISKPLVAT